MSEKSTKSSKIKSIKPIYYRSIFISDVHLGFSGCSADYLLDFLRATKCDYLFLVGDIVDVWQMKKKLFWPQAHNDVIRTILGKAKHGTRIIYVPGNHDEVIRDFAGIKLGNLEIHRQFIHKSADGRRYLVLHGDEFDGVVTNSRLFGLVGSSLYVSLLKLNIVINFTRRKLGFPYWSLAGVLKHKVKSAVSYISNFETVLAYESTKHNVDGIISGHIHRAQINKIKDSIYCNCGDWVESCTALVEWHDGSMELLHWSEKQESIKVLEKAA